MSRMPALLTTTGFIPVEPALIGDPGASASSAPTVLHHHNADGTITTIRSLADAVELFGAGSIEAAWARRYFERPKPLLCSCGATRTPQDSYQCRPCRERSARFDALYGAFHVLGRCLLLVEEYAKAFYETAPGRVAVTWDYSTFWAEDYRGQRSKWTGHAFDALARIYERAPELLPFHDDGDDA